MQPLPDTSQNRPLSLLHVLAPGEVGGLETVVRLLAAGQLRAGHTVSVLSMVLTDQPEPGLHRALSAAGVSVVPLSLPPRSYLRERRELRAVLTRLRPDIVHTHGYRPDVQVGAVARSLNLATVSTVHGFVGGDWKNRFYEFLQGRAIRGYGAVVAVSRPMMGRLEAAGVPARALHCVPNAWAEPVPPLSREQARAVLGLPPEAFVVGWVGRLSREKGADVLIEAARLLSDLPITFSILGDGAERAALEAEAAALGLSARVRWHGVVPDASRLYPAFDVFALSSRTEGTPMALFEAMASGVPIVATRVGGVPDVVSDREASLVPAEDPPLFAQALRRLYAAADEGRALATAARRRLETQFALEPWVMRYDVLYRALIGAAAPAGGNG